MNAAEQALVREMIRAVIQEEVPHLLASQKCLLEPQGIPLYEHREHHMMISKLIEDIGSTRKAFLGGVITTITGGILGLIWLYTKGKLKGWVPWL